MNFNKEYCTYMMKLLGIDTLVPEHSYNEEELFSFYSKWVAHKNDEFRSKAINIFRNAEIKRKFSIIPIEEIFTKRSIDISNQLYKTKAIEYSCSLAQQCLKNVGIKPEQVDFLITTSCTGWMIPSLNTYLINQCGFRNDIINIPISGYGCVGGVGAMILADKLLASKPNSKVLVLNLEFSTNTMQYEDFSLDNIVSVALFSDGVACAVLDNSNKTAEGLKFIDNSMQQIPQTENILRYDLTSDGFKMTLSRELPIVIKQNFEPMVSNFLQKNSLEISDLDHILVHPGGIKILENIEELLKKYSKDLSISKKIMQNYGNMSSATVMFILQELLQRKFTPNQNILLVAFGPGFCMYQILFKYVTR